MVYVFMTFTAHFGDKNWAYKQERITVSSYQFKY